MPAVGVGVGVGCAKDLHPSWWVWRELKVYMEWHLHIVSTCSAPRKLYSQRRAEVDAIRLAVGMHTPTWTYLLAYMCTGRVVVAVFREVPPSTCAILGEGTGCGVL